MPAKSLFYTSSSVLHEPPTCAPCRQEVVATFRKDGRLYTMTMTDKTVIEDHYLVLVKAAAFAIRMQEPYQGRLIPRDLKDFMLKSAV